MNKEQIIELIKWIESMKSEMTNEGKHCAEMMIEDLKRRYLYLSE